MSLAQIMFVSGMVLVLGAALFGLAVMVTRELQEMVEERAWGCLLAGLTVGLGGVLVLAGVILGYAEVR